MYHQPQFLKYGDQVAVVAPAKAVDQQKLASGIEILKSWGLVVKEGQHLLSKYHQFAGNDGERKSDLQEALDIPEIKAIFCARGGYGTSRIIERLDFSGFKKAPKWIVGFSDITVLLGEILNQGFQCVHGPMPTTFGIDKSAASLQLLHDLLFGKQTSVTVDHHSLNRQGTVAAEVTGGNLAIVTSMIGTSSDQDTEGKILFLEDVGEYLYRIDRMVIHLKRAGKLDKLAGLIVGGFSEMLDNDIPFGKDSYEIIAEAVSEYEYPVLFNFPAGHCQDNHSLVFGKKATLSVQTGKSSLSYSYSL